jgi:hypothetical protein
MISRTIALVILREEFMALFAFCLDGRAPIYSCCHQEPNFQRASQTEVFRAVLRFNAR